MEVEGLKCLSSDGEMCHDRLMRGTGKEGFSRWWVWTALLLICLLVVGIWQWQRIRSDSSELAFETVVVERGDIVQSVLATGELNPVRTVQVGSQISGNIMELLADFNSVVRRGDVIARLDPSIYEANVSLAEAEWNERWRALNWLKFNGNG